MNITESPHFLAWKGTLENAGNTLEQCDPLWVFEVGNGFILSRPDIAHVVVLRRDDEDLLNSDVVMVREFRSTSRTLDGFIRECPGGSGFKPMNPRENAAKELSEELGLTVDPERLKMLQSKQVCGTFSTHKAHVFVLEITDQEFATLRADKEARGVTAEGERTYVETCKAADLFCPEYDWANTGMVLMALLR